MASTSCRKSYSKTRAAVSPAIAVAAAIASTAVQPRPASAFGGPQRRFERIAAALKLGPKERSRIGAIIEKTRADAQKVRARLHKERRALRQLMREDSPKQAAVLARVEAVYRFKLQLAKLRLRTLLRVRQMLTPHQRQQLIALRRKRRAALRAACRADARRLCPSTRRARGKKRCLLNHFDQLTARCRKAVVHRLRWRRHRR